MKVTVLSPVTAEVTVAQASAWLERNGWKRQPRRRLCSGVAWEYIGIGLGIGLIDADDYSDGPRRLAETIADIARIMCESPAKILREMAEVVT